MGQPARKADQHQPGTGEPKCKETKASAAAAAAEVPELPAAAKFPATTAATSAAEFPKLPATAEFPAAAAADLPELWCTAAAAEVSTVCSTGRVRPAARPRIKRDQEAVIIIDFNWRRASL